jgi:hypothetical protein
VSVVSGDASILHVATVVGRKNQRVRGCNARAVTCPNIRVVCYPKGDTRQMSESIFRLANVVNHHLGLTTQILR